MNKQGKASIGVILVVIAGLLLLFFLLYSPGAQKTVEEHRVPADISKQEKGTGLDLKFYDGNGNPIQIPDWFSTASVVPLSDFTIVRRPTAPTCTTVSQCAGYATNPNIMCWTGKCVLGNVASMDVGVNVVNPSSSEIAFLNLAPTTITPAAVNTVFNKSTFAKLSPGQSRSWQTTSPVSVTSWQGTQQTFSISVAGTNQYTGQVSTVTDSLVLAFDADPTGLFTVSVTSPI